MTAGERCRFASCTGVIDAGYCNLCGRAPRRPPPPHVARGATASRSVPTPTLRPTSVRTQPRSGRPSVRLDSGRTSSRRSGSSRRGLGLGLVEVPSVPTGDPADAVMALPEVPEDKRYCSNCQKAVGRSRQQRPGRTEGFCPHCRAHFSFTPKLAAGDVLAGQYEVLGAIAHGGLGWIYLARDRAVSDRWVVLKGLLDTASEDAAIAAVAERRFLAAIDHPNIVEIYNFVTHAGAGYIVMEYVGGKSLKTLLKERREVNGGKIDPLPMDRAIAYVLGVLPALGYLHSQGLVYCDMKPDNVLLSGDGLKIIDLGGVRPIDDEDAAIYGTAGYQAPEVSEVGPSVASDLYTVGRMLAVLVLEFRGYQSSYADRLPSPDDQPLLAGEESLHRFLLKATALDPDDRFMSAEEMAEQLVGILREEAADRGDAKPGVSTIFGPDGLVGGTGHDDVTPDWRRLPRPKVDAEDPGAVALLGLASNDPASMASALAAGLNSGSVPTTIETVLALARANLDAGWPATTTEVLDTLGGVRDWRLWWIRGLVALSEGKAVDAVDWFDPVYTDLAGEVGAKLGLALAHEMAGDLDRSAELYDMAGRTDPSYVSAAFGLARARRGLGDREGAVSALGRVPQSSSAYAASRLAMVQSLADHAGSVGIPSAVQLGRASKIVERLDLDPVRRAEMARELYEAGIFALAGRSWPPGAGSGRFVLGRRLVEADLRRGLEETYRRLARHAGSPGERVRLVDSANRVRPRTLL